MALGPLLLGAPNCVKWFRKSTLNTIVFGIIISKNNTYYDWHWNCILSNYILFPYAPYSKKCSNYFTVSVSWKSARHCPPHNLYQALNSTIDNVFSFTSQYFGFTFCIFNEIPIYFPWINPSGNSICDHTFLGSQKSIFLETVGDAVSVKKIVKWIIL